MYYQLIPLDSERSRDGAWRLTLPSMIGRGTECGVCIDDESISRTHCQVYLAQDDSLQVRDLNSTNGTYVNGERIKQHHSLVPGDVIQIGTKSLQVQYASDTDPGPTVPKPKAPSMNKTQLVKTTRAETFTMHEVTVPARKWWEFWRS